MEMITMPETFKRDKPLISYVSKQELEFIGRIAREFGYPSVSSFVRQAVFEVIAALQRRQQTELG